jgi:hypothetical protein
MIASRVIVAFLFIMLSGVEAPLITDAPWAKKSS